jgi:glycosyltransferase involved in cell wall biosynthesis
MAPLRVCAISFDLYPYDVLVRRTSEAAADAGYQVDVICLSQPGQKPYEVCDGVHVYRIPMYRSFGRSLPFTVLEWLCFLVLAALKVTRLHFKERYDVIHVHNMPDFLVFCALIPRLLGAKVILEIQDVSPELMGAKAKGRFRGLILRLARWQERLSTAFAHHVITVGMPFARLLLQRGVPPEKMTIILNSADPKLHPAARRTEPSLEPASEDRPYILMYHGTLAERNGLDTALRAFAQARAVVPHLRFDIKGRGEAIPHLKQLAKELGISEQVIFTDPCPSEELVEFVVHGDVGIIPYRSDSFMDLVLPTKAYEFAWMHRPMIASDTAAIRSMFRAESMVLCDPSSPAAFAEAIIDLYQHPEKRTRLVASAVEDYQPYQWEIMAKRYTQLLLDVCTSPKEKVGTGYPTVSDEVSQPEIPEHAH